MATTSPPRSVVVLNDVSIKSYRHAALFFRASYTGSLLERIAADSVVPAVKSAAGAEPGGSSASQALAKLARVNSIDFHENGALLVSSDDLGGISLLNVAMKELILKMFINFIFIEVKVFLYY